MLLDVRTERGTELLKTGQVATLPGAGKGCQNLSKFLQVTSRTRGPRDASEYVCVRSQGHW